MGHSLRLYSVCHFRGNFNVNLSRAHYDTNSTGSDKMIRAFDAKGAKTTANR